MTDRGGLQAGPLAALAALGEEMRLRLYTFTRAAGRPVSREEAAASTGISRKLAAFHLDRLVAAGLLRARYGPAAGRRRAGRAPKLYEPAATDISVSIPPRRHDVLAGILLDALLGQERSESARSAATRAAWHWGRLLGAGERSRMRAGRLGAERALTLAGQVLAESGFEPQRASAARMLLRNCPFQPLAARAPDLVCAVNHAYLSGLLDGLGAGTVRALLAPEPGSCCVTLAG